MNELIWWTTQLDCESISEERRDMLPNYIKEQFSSRCGRSGRGRLWVANRCKTKSIEWNENSPLSNVCANSGGIIIMRRDVKYVQSLPGVITELNLIRI